MSIMSTGTSALIAFQRALSTVSHNVANINTEGYSRQRVEFATRTPTDMGYAFVGNGAKITDVSRVADQLATSRLLDSGGELSRLQQLSSLSNRVDSLYSNTATNVAGLWSNFFDSTSAGRPMPRPPPSGRACSTAATRWPRASSSSTDRWTA